MARTIPIRETLTVEFKSDLKKYGDAALFEDVVAFANTEGGVQSSAMIYSLIETAKKNCLTPYRYLVYVPARSTRLGAKGDCWAEELLQECIKEGCCGVLKSKD